MDAETETRLSRMARGAGDYYDDAGEMLKRFEAGVVKRRFCRRNYVYNPVSGRCQASLLVSTSSPLSSCTAFTAVCLCLRRNAPQIWLQTPALPWQLLNLLKIIAARRLSAGLSSRGALCQTQIGGPLPSPFRSRPPPLP